MRTLNSVECVAKGCSLQAAMLSPNYAVADYKIDEFNATPVSISYQFDDQEDKSKWVVKELFGLGSSFPSTKSITFDNKVGGM
jgi:heat shock protein 4